MADACECGNEPSGFVKCGEFLDCCKPVSFTRRTLHHGVSKYVNRVRLTVQKVNNIISKLIHIIILP